MKDSSRITMVSVPSERAADAATPSSPPEDFRSILEMDRVALMELGMLPWGNKVELPDGSDDKTSPLLILFPPQWYEHIPEGFPIVDINFRPSKFCSINSDDSARLGCLAYGVLVPGVRPA